MSGKEEMMADAKDAIIELLSKGYQVCKGLKHLEFSEDLKCIAFWSKNRIHKEILINDVTYDQMIKWLNDG